MDHRKGNQELMQIITSLEQQKLVYSKLDEEGKKRWEHLFRTIGCFTEEQLAEIKEQ